MKFKKQTLTKIGLIAIILSVALPSFTPARGDQLDAQIRALQKQAASQQATATDLHNKANDYKSKVASLQAQIEATQTQIVLNQAKLDQIDRQIDDVKTQITQQKEVLNESIRAIYKQGDVSSIEILASSDSFSDFVNKQEYTQKVKDKVTDTLTKINKLKDELEKQQVAVKTILADQQSQKDELSSNKAQQDSLLALANRDAAAADAQVRNSNAQIAKLQAQQAAIIQAASHNYTGSIPGASNGSGGACDNGHGNGGYPSVWCNAPQDYYSTPWGYSRECVSWAGWRRSQIGRPVYAWGNANTWDDRARSAGYSVNYTPEVGAVAQTDAGYYGHVAVVEAIQGNSVVVSEMNYDGYGHFRYSTYPTSYFKYIH